MSGSAARVWFWGDLSPTVAVEGVDMTRSLRAVWSAGRRIGPDALDVLAVAERHRLG